MKFLRTAGLVICTLLESIFFWVGFWMVLDYNEKSPFDPTRSLMGVLVMMALLFVVVYIMTRIRDLTDELLSPFVFMYFLIELVLSPFAFLRVIVGFILSKVSPNRDGFVLEPTDMYGTDDLMNKVSQYVFYHSVSDSSTGSRLGNFFMQLFVMLPMASALTGVTWLGLGSLFPIFPEEYRIELDPITLFALFYVWIFLAYMYSLFKTKTIEVRTSGFTEFTHKRSGRTYYRDGAWTMGGRNSDWSEYYVPSSTSVMLKNATLLYTLNIIFSPVIAFTQAIGVIFAFFALFIKHIYSCYGEINMKYVDWKILQAPLAYFFSFVFI